MLDLSRSKIFPMYIKEYKMIKIDKELRNRDQLARARQEQLSKEKEKLKRQNPQHGTLFKLYFSLMEKNQMTMVADILELVEAHYSPRVQEDYDKILKQKQGLEKIDGEIFKLEEEKGKIKANATPEQILNYEKLQKQRDEIKSQIDIINANIEDKVLDSELFLREAKQFVLTKTKQQQKSFFTTLS